MRDQNRRTFLATSSLALAGAAFHPSRASSLTLPKKVAISTNCADDYLLAPVPPDALQLLALRAMDAAKSAGATYADIRVGEQHVMQYELRLPGPDPTVFLYPMFGYGVRVAVDGAWAFTHGSQFSPDAVVASVRDAVAMARSYVRVTKHSAEFLPTPVVTGEWSTPITEDPFTVPLYDHAAILGAYIQAMGRVPHCGVAVNYQPTFHWTRERRVFASSEGAQVTQVLYGSRPVLGIGANVLFGDVVVQVPDIAEARSGGFELVSNPALQDVVKARAELALRFGQLPRTLLDVGRYPLVVDGASCGMLLGRTLGVALELDRALGYEADAGGTSYLSPPAALLGTPIAHPSMTVTATRTLPSAGAVKWDDEGVEPHDYPVITDGQLAAYHGSRQTLAALGPNLPHGPSPRSAGCLVAARAEQMPLVRAPHLVLGANPQRASLEVLCQEVKHGLLLLSRNQLTSDQQCKTGMITFNRYSDSGTDGILIEIKNGQMVRRVMGNGLQFNAQTLWLKKLMGLGDASTMCPSSFEVDKGMPNYPAVQTATAPAALFSEVDVILTESAA